VFVPTGGQLGIVARVFDLKPERVTLLTMALVGATRGFDRGVDGLGLDRLEHLGANRGFDGLPREGHTRCTRGLMMATQAANSGLAASRPL